MTDSMPIEGQFRVDERLRTFPCWIAYQMVDDGRKIPCDPRSVEPDAINGHDPANTTDFETAMDTLAESRAELGHDEGLTGLGICLDAVPNLVCLDLDDVVVDDNELIDLAADVVDRVDSYTERSPSGTGLHVLVYDPEGADDDYKTADTIEVYDARFVTYSGRHVPSTPDEVVEHEGIVGEIQREYNDRREGAGWEPTAGSGSDDGDEPDGLLDEINRAEASVGTNTSSSSVGADQGDASIDRGDLPDHVAERVEALCNHDPDGRLLYENGSTAWQQWPSSSHADMSLANKICWWALRADKFDGELTEGEIRQAFLASDLAQRSERPKCEREDYVELTIRKAIDNHT